MKVPLLDGGFVDLDEAVLLASSKNCPHCTQWTELYIRSGVFIFVKRGYPEQDGFAFIVPRGVARNFVAFYASPSQVCKSPDYGLILRSNS